MIHRSLFVWFPVSRRWVAATWEGARECAIEKGLEVAYGLRPPVREGYTYEHTPPLWRVHAWMDFVDAVMDRPDERHRLGSMTVKC